MSALYAVTLNPLHTYLFYCTVRSSMLYYCNIGEMSVVRLDD